MRSQLQAALEALSEESRDTFVPSHVPRIAGPPEPHRFFREHVALSRPCIFTGCIEHWPALTRWTHAYLRSVAGTCDVHCAQTCDGLADAVVRHLSGELVFSKPHEALMPLNAFLDAVATPLFDAEGRVLRPVHYVSHQNGSLASEFSALWPDTELSMGWADAAFGGPPEAANLWIGEDAARTSAHADLYDNVYAVVRGEKRFTLLPPQDVPALGARSFRTASWRPSRTRGAGGDAAAAGAAPATEASELSLELDEPEARVRWIPLDLESPAAVAALPGVRPLEVVVRAGEVLYLPAHWVHAVSQRGDAERTTIAVNYWYGSETLGPMFSQSRLLERLADLVQEVRDGEDPST